MGRRNDLQLNTDKVRRQGARKPGAQLLTLNMFRRAGQAHFKFPTNAFSLQSSLMSAKLKLYPEKVKEMSLLLQ